MTFQVDDFSAHDVEFESIKLLQSKLCHRELMLTSILKQAIVNMCLLYLVVPLKSSDLISTKVQVISQCHGHIARHTSDLVDTRIDEAYLCYLAGIQLYQNIRLFLYLTL